MATNSMYKQILKHSHAVIVTESAPAEEEYRWIQRNWIQDKRGGRETADS